MRSDTERPEGVSAGTAKLVGIDKKNIIDSVNQLIHDRDLYNSMSKAVNPYGDGTTSRKIHQIMSSTIKN